MVMLRFTALTTLVLAHHALAQVVPAYGQVRAAVLPSAPMICLLIDNVSVEDILGWEAQCALAGKVSYIHISACNRSNTERMIQLVNMPVNSQLSRPPIRALSMPNQRSIIYISFSVCLPPSDIPSNTSTSTSTSTVTST